MVNPFFSWKSLEDSYIEDKYHLTKFIASGTFGGVFKANEMLLDNYIRQVAIKLIQIKEDEYNPYDKRRQSQKEKLNRL